MLKDYDTILEASNMTSQPIGIGYKRLVAPLLVLLNMHYIQIKPLLTAGVEYCQHLSTLFMFGLTGATGYCEVAPCINFHCLSFACPLSNPG